MLSSKHSYSQKCKSALIQPTIIKQVNNMKLKSSLTLVFLTLFTIQGFTQFKGAHLSSQVINKNLNVTLKVYYDCNYAQAPEFEYVALFETLIKSSKQYIKLNKESVEEKLNNVSAPCKNLNHCFFEVTYKGTIQNLNSLPKGYELTWANCCLQNDFVNVTHNGEFGIVLQNKINEFEIEENNTPPSILQLPFLVGCSNYENNIFFNYIDKEEGDDVKISSQNIFTNLSSEDKMTIGQIGPDGISEIPSPPYNQLKYSDNYSFSSVFGNSSDFSINDTTKVIKWNCNKSGKYLIKLNLEESRKNQTINSSQIIFITELN